LAQRPRILLEPSWHLPRHAPPASLLSEQLAVASDLAGLTLEQHELEVPLPQVCIHTVSGRQGCQEPDDRTLSEDDL
jgi:hypothetical protein